MATEISGRIWQKRQPHRSGASWVPSQGRRRLLVLAAGERFEGFAKKEAALSGHPCSPCRQAFRRLSRRCRSTLGHRPPSSRIQRRGRDHEDDTGCPHAIAQDGRIVRCGEPNRTCLCKSGHSDRGRWCCLAIPFRPRRDLCERFAHRSPPSRLGESIFYSVQVDSPARTNCMVHGQP